MHQTSLNTNKPDKQQRKGQMLSYLLFIEVKEYLGSGPAITSASRSGSRLSMLTRLQTSPISVQETSLRPNISERTSPSDDDRDDATMTHLFRVISCIPLSRPHAHGTRLTPAACYQPAISAAQHSTAAQSSNTFRLVYSPRIGFIIVDIAQPTAYSSYVVQLYCRASPKE